MTIIILKFIAVVVILAAMLMILLGIGHLFSGNFHSDSEDAEKLRQDVENNTDVVSPRSLFYEFLKGENNKNAGGFHRSKK